MTVPVQFDVWGCRGSRNLVPNRSSIGNRTSCYSILGPESLVVLDAGRGIAALGSAMLTDPRFAHVKEIHVLLTHAHLDHFEGLKDVDWFWKRGNGLSLVLHGTEEALSSVATVFAPPIYVTLPVLADGTLGSFTVVPQRAGDSFAIPGFTVDVFPLYHYSGISSAKFALDTIGYRVASTAQDGPVVAYLSDHEPTKETAPLEKAARSGAHLVIYDAHFLDVKDHAFGHGSQEYTAGVARAESSALVLAGHLSPNVTDTALHETRKRHGEDVPNFALAAEGDRWQWDEDSLRFLKVREGPEEPVQPLTPPALADQLSFNATQLSKVRHELRTPINQILGYSELLEEQAEDEGQQGYIPDLRKIQAAGRRLLGMLDEHLAPPSKQSLAQAKAADAVAEGTGRDSGVKWKALAESAMAMAQTQQAQHGPGVPSATATPASLDPGEIVATASASSKEILKGADDGDGHPGQASGKLLVVDDNELNRDMLSRRLQQRGYTVKTAEDGEKALARIEDEKFDTVLLDVMMPGISGLEVLEILRKTYTVAALPVIMATARDDSQDIVEALKLGANDYVTKPLDFPVVLARLETQLALKRATEQLEKRNQFIRNTFGRYLSDDVVASLLESESGLALGGENRNLTILMSDLRGFTSAAERLAPEQVVRVLNTYLAAMTDVIQQHKGTIDEFIGDAILAIFGAPQSYEDDAERAVACALAMQLAMEDVNRKIAEDGFPPVEMGIALNTGNVVVGNIGSQTRAKYGVVGSHVNLAARIESYSVGGQVLISEMTLLQAGAGVSVGKKIIINAKGFKDPIPIYDVRAISGKYNFTLPDAGEPLVELSHPIPVRFTMIIEKHVGEEVHQARILRMSEKEAELQCDAEVPEMTNVKVRVVGASGEEIPADLYGKVMGTLDGVKGFLLRFTAMPPEVDRFFKSVLKADA